MSVEKMNIQFRIRAVDNFSKTMNKLHRRITNIKRHVETLDDVGNINIDVTGDAKAKRDLKKVGREADKLERKSFRVLVTTSAMGAVEDFRKSMSRIARLSRDVGEVAIHQLGSAFVAMSSTGVAAIGVLAGALGTIGPIIGVTAGGIMGLGTAFGIAGIGAAGFGALAVSSLSDVFAASSELKSLQEELDATTDAEERAEIMKEMASIQSQLSKEQKGALSSIDKLGKTWSGISKALEPKVITAFIGAMDAFDSVLSSLAPMFEGVANAAINLVDSLNVNIKSNDFEAFTDFLNQSAGPIMETMTKAVGNFAMGILNMLTAFGPLATDMADGFNDMGESFRKWAGGLSESKKFQAFIEYTKENGPKLLGIIGGIFTGLTDMFSAFGPLASDMLDGLLGMVEGFKEWAAALSENPAFQEFIDFVREQGPNVLEFLSEMRDFLINVGIGFATVSEFMTPFLTEVFELINGIMEHNRWIAEAIGWLTTLGGVFMFIWTPIALFRAILKNLAPVFSEIFKWISSKILPIFTRLYLFWQQTLLPIISRLWQAFLRAGPMLARVGGFFLRFITGPVGWIITAVVGLVAIIASNWEELWAATKRGFQQIGDFISSTFKTVVGWGAKIGGWVNEVIGFFGELWSGVKTKMSEVGEAVSTGWDYVMEFLGGIDLFDIGANIIDGMISGITSMGRNLVESAKGVVNDAIEGAKNLLGIKSPSRVFMEIGKFTGEGMVIGMDRMKRGVHGAAERMANASIPSAQGFSAHGNIVRSRGEYEANRYNSGVALQPAPQSNETETKQPLYFTFQLGDDDYDAFIDDVNKRQGAVIKTRKRRKGGR